MNHVHVHADLPSETTFAGLKCPYQQSESFARLETLPKLSTIFMHKKYQVSTVETPPPLPSFTAANTLPRSWAIVIMGSTISKPSCAGISFPAAAMLPYVSLLHPPFACLASACFDNQYVCCRDPSCPRAHLTSSSRRYVVLLASFGQSRVPAGLLRSCLPVRRSAPRPAR